MSEVEWFRRFPNGGGTVYMKPADSGTPVALTCLPGRAQFMTTQDEGRSAPHLLAQSDDERIDRVAQALHEQRALEFAWNAKPWKELRAEDQRRFRRQAMAAIEAVFAGVSSSEVEAPQPQPLQHSTHTWENGGVWHGLCVTFECGERVKGCQAAVEDWKDQHEADTLRPVLDEGRPSGSGRLAPRPMETLCGATGYWGTRRYQCDLPADHEKHHENNSEIPGVCWFGDHTPPCSCGRCEEWANEADGKCSRRATDSAAQAARSEATPRTWDINASEPREVGLKVKGDTNGVVFDRREGSHDPDRWRALPPEGDGGYYSWRVMNHGLFAEAQSFTEVLPCAAQEKKEGEASER